MKTKRFYLYLFLLVALIVHVNAYAKAPAETTSATVYTANDQVQVEWKGKWYPSTIKEVKDGKYLIHYTGWSDSWNEWVGTTRIRTSEKAVAAFAVGEKVQVEWKNSWFKATVKEVKEGKFLIHYDGYDNSWDEWVSTNRIRKN
ncbi:MAG: Tudor-knot domain-containing protein [bacterium]|nr:RNA-binding protein [bacterium]MBU1917636.1 RNA-binding protein [bacterium]